jgi:hypothetical protein
MGAGSVHGSSLLTGQAAGPGEMVESEVIRAARAARFGVGRRRPIGHGSLRTRAPPPPTRRQDRRRRRSQPIAPYGFPRFRAALPDLRSPAGDRPGRRVGRRHAAGRGGQGGHHATQAQVAFICGVALVAFVQLAGVRAAAASADPEEGRGVVGAVRLQVEGIHTTLLPTGRVLLFQRPKLAYGSDARVWGPGDRRHRRRELRVGPGRVLRRPLPAPDGRILVTGGHVHGAGLELGADQTDVLTRPPRPGPRPPPSPRRGGTRPRWRWATGRR